MFRPIALSLPLLMLAACDGGGTTATPVTNTATAAPDGYATRIKALSPRLRSGVFLRAIRDGGEECQEVTREFAIAPVDNRPAWAVICDQTNPWVVSIDPGGTAIVSKPTTASQLEPAAG